MTKKLIKLYKNNCRPCVEVTGYLEENAVPHESFNIMENIDLAMKYSVMTVPVTILLDENENEVGRVMGFDEDALEQLIEQL